MQNVMPRTAMLSGLFCFSLGVKVEFFWLTKVTTPSTVVLISCSCIGVGRGKWIFWLLFACFALHLREKNINSHFM